LFAHQGNIGAVTSPPKPIVKVAENDQHGTFALFLARLKLQLQRRDNKDAKKCSAKRLKKNRQEPKNST
jgi:hypothetical protein